jgi:hypothetical protein
LVDAEVRAKEIFPQHERAYRNDNRRQYVRDDAAEPRRPGSYRQRETRRHKTQRRVRLHADVARQHADQRRIIQLPAHQYSHAQRRQQPRANPDGPLQP